MRKYLLFGHGGAYNHGAEAIVRTTVELIKKNQFDAYIVLSSHFPDQDREFGLNYIVDKIIPADLSFKDDERYANNFEDKLIAAQKMYEKALSEIDHNTICIGIGGDNYCYPNWHRQVIFLNTAKKCGARCVLWGCSIQPNMINEAMIDALKKHDMIYARESITYEKLMSIGINNIKLVYDSAFNLIPEKIALSYDISGRIIAINISPLTIRREKNLLNYFILMTKSLLKNSDYLLMVHHVITPADDDRDASYTLFSQLSTEERKKVYFIPDNANAAQIKYLISKCEMLVCCRTHASIAGYSSCVPTLAVSYSVKADGIGKDLGMEQWVIPISECDNLPYLAMKMWNERKSIQSNLQEIIPNYDRFIYNFDCLH